MDASLFHVSFLTTFWKLPNYNTQPLPWREDKIPTNIFFNNENKEKKAAKFTVWHRWTQNGRSSA